MARPETEEAVPKLRRAMTAKGKENDYDAALKDDKTMLAFAIEKIGDKSGKVMRMEKPVAKPGEALIRVLRAGVCNTDLELLQGYMGFSGILGHEFVGVVESICEKGPSSEENKKWIGKRVCGDINVGCSTCAVCLDVHKRNFCCPQMSRNHCPNRTVLGILNKHGAMAEYITLPFTNLHLVPDAVSDEEAAFAEPLAAACRIVEQNLVDYEHDPPDKVAILGDGKLGLMIAEVLGRKHTEAFGMEKELPPRPMLFGKHVHKMDLVATSGVDCFLVDELLHPEAYNGVKLKYSAYFDVVVDATGNPSTLSVSAAICRPMGNLVLKSTCAAGERFNAAPFVIDELRVIGSRCGPIDKALKLLSLGTNHDDEEQEIDADLEPLNVSKYITKTFPLYQADKAIACAAERSTMKVQIICSDK